MATLIYIKFISTTTTYFSSVLLVPITVVIMTLLRSSYIYIKLYDDILLFNTE